MEELEAEVTRSQEEHAACRRAGGWKSGIVEKTAMSRLESQWKERSARREEISREVERLGVERARLLADNIELDRKAAGLAEEVLSIESQVNHRAEEATSMRASLAAGEENLKAIRMQVDEARERRSHIEVELVKLQAELKFLDETSRKELNLPVEQLTEPALDDDGVAEAERLCQKSGPRFEAMGPVNTQALEEFHERSSVTISSTRSVRTCSIPSAIPRKPFTR